MELDGRGLSGRRLHIYRFMFVHHVLCASYHMWKEGQALGRRTPMFLKMTCSGR